MYDYLNKMHLSLYLILYNLKKKMKCMEFDNPYFLLLHEEEINY